MDLTEGKWYGWQMLPGYGAGAPYFSPIRLDSVRRLAAPNTATLTFFNACYAHGVRDFKQRVRFIFQADSYLLCKLLPNDLQRTAAISELSEHWIDTCCPYLWEVLSRGSDVQSALSELYPSQS